MSQTIEETNKRLVLEAFDTLFNKRDYKAAERLWSPNYIQHSAHIPPGREGLFDLIRSIPPTLRYEAGVMLAEGDSVMVHGRFSGIGQPANWIVVDIVRLEDGVLAEHWDVLQDEASKESSRSGLPMFGDAFPARQSGAAERPAHRDARAVELHACRDWMSESRPSSRQSSRPDADEDTSRSRPSPKGLLVTLEVPERGGAPSVRKGIR